MRHISILIFALLLSACDSKAVNVQEIDGGMDAWVDTDSGMDATVDTDAGTDSGTDAFVADAGTDSGTDAGMDAGTDSGVDAGPPAPVCGNSVVEAGEGCDDGNALTESCAYGQTSCTVCDMSCQNGPGVVTGYCGDGQKNGPEACDDGNQVAHDGCENNCTVTLRWVCLDHEITNFLGVTTTPALCDSALGEYTFDANAVAITIAQQIQASGSNTSVYSAPVDEMRIQAGAVYVYKARPCYHYDVLPSNMKCAAVPY